MALRIVEYSEYTERMNIMRERSGNLKDKALAGGKLATFSLREKCP